MVHFNTVALLLFCFFCSMDIVKCNFWSDHGPCVPGSDLHDANLAITRYYLNATYHNLTDFTYVMHERTYRVWLDKNPAFPTDKPNRKSWQACNVGRYYCDEEQKTLSGGGACCYDVVDYSGVATECMKMDIS